MKTKVSRNRTLHCEESELTRLTNKIKYLDGAVSLDDLHGQIISGDIFEVADNLPKHSFDLIILDPPYNLLKNYNGYIFKEKEKESYRLWFDKLVTKLKPCLKETATIYICSDWKTSTIIAPILENYFHVRNRITWERDKGRGAKKNWKNNTEDIWFCTLSDNYYFDVNAVKLKRKVIAPYKVNGNPKGWHEEADGNYRLTHPSNLWSDMTIPFWSMPENTDHPTQKPEKLIAKLILASSKPNDMVFDPFLGSGTTAVVAKKLGRKYFAIEMDPEYCCWALKRLELAEQDNTIQGYVDGVFWERNTLNQQPAKNKKKNHQPSLDLFL